MTKTISFNEFIKKYLGKPLDFDGYYGGQCVDLFRYYVKEVLGLPQSLGVGGATEIWYSAQDEYYDFIKLSELDKNPPKNGDIIIWNRNVGGGAGHVSIFLEKINNDKFISLDQNWPTLNKVTQTEHNYNNIIGWLRPKGVFMTACLLENTEENRNKFEELVSKSSRYDEFKKEGYENVAQVNHIVGELKQNVIDANEAKKIEKTRADNARNDLNEFVATLADEEHLHTVQEKVEILAQASRAGNNAKELEDLKRNFGVYKETSENTMSELNIEIKRLKALLNNENVLENSTLQELIGEVIKKLVSIVQKTKKVR